MAKYQCTYCQGEIGAVWIKCRECPDFDLCLQCFSCGVEVGRHKKEHDYQVIENGSFHIFGEDVEWVATEEVTLLEAVEQYGFGNWEDVARHVGTRTAEDCQLHYRKFYILGSIGQATFTADISNKVIDHTCPGGGPLSPSLTTPLPSLEMTLQEQHDLGYMPLRDDFEREYDNDAETLISSLALNYDDEDVDIAVKLAQVDMYRQRLKERQRLKRISRDYSLISNMLASSKKNKTQENKRKLSKDDREFQERMRIFAQFQSSNEHEQFFENLHKEKLIKTRIKELMRFRRNGITKLDDCAQFETERYKREKKKENKKKMAAISTPKRTSMVSKKAGEKLHVETKEELDGKGDNKISKDNGSLPGFGLLTDRERKLCDSIGMKPANYITIKTCIIKDYLQRRQGLPVKIRYPSGMDKTHRRKILNFLSDNGWIGIS